MSLGITAQRVDMDRPMILTAEWLSALVGLAESSQVGRGLGRVLQTMLPLQLAERTEIARIEPFDPHRLPWLARIEHEETKEVKLNPITLQTEVRTEVKAFLIEPLGYLWRVLGKMVETLEIGLWGTIVAVLVSLPLALWSA